MLLKGKVYHTPYRKMRGAHLHYYVCTDTEQILKKMQVVTENGHWNSTRHSLRWCRSKSLTSTCVCISLLLFFVLDSCRRQNQFLQISRPRTLPCCVFCQISPPAVGVSHVPQLSVPPVDVARPARGACELSRQLPTSTRSAADIADATRHRRCRRATDNAKFTTPY